MTFRGYSAVLAVVMFAGLSSATAASATPAATAEGDIVIAEAFWGGPPPQCSTVNFSATAAPGNGGEATQPSPYYYGPCELSVVEVNASTADTPETVCMIMLHEFGHLWGHGHSGDPDSVMVPHPIPARLAAQESPEAMLCAEPEASLPNERARNERLFAWGRWEEMRDRCERRVGTHRKQCFQELGRLRTSIKRRFAATAV